VFKIQASTGLKPVYRIQASTESKPPLDSSLLWHKVTISRFLYTPSEHPAQQTQTCSHTETHTHQNSNTSLLVSHLAESAGSTSCFNAKFFSKAAFRGKPAGRLSRAPACECAQDGFGVRGQNRFSVHNVIYKRGGKRGCPAL